MYDVLSCYLKVTLTFSDRSYIDKHQETYVKHLADVVAIKSVSAWPDHRDEIVVMVQHTAKVFRGHIYKQPCVFYVKFSIQIDVE